METKDYTDINVLTTMLHDVNWLLAGLVENPNSYEDSMVFKQRYDAYQEEVDAYNDAFERGKVVAENE